MTTIIYQTNGSTGTEEPQQQLLERIENLTQNNYKWIDIKTPQNQPVTIAIHHITHITTTP